MEGCDSFEKWLHEQVTPAVQGLELDSVFILKTELEKVLRTAYQYGQRAQRERDAQIAEQWDDSLQDLDLGVSMVSILKYGLPDTEGGVTITPLDDLEPWERKQAELLAEFREVARREEHRIIADTIRQQEADGAQ